MCKYENINFIIIYRDIISYYINFYIIYFKIFNRETNIDVFIKI